MGHLYRTNTLCRVCNCVLPPFKKEAPDVPRTAPAVYLLGHVDRRVGIRVHEDGGNLPFEHCQVRDHFGFELLHAKV